MTQKDKLKSTIKELADLGKKKGGEIGQIVKDYVKSGEAESDIKAARTKIKDGLKNLKKKFDESKTKEE